MQTFEHKGVTITLDDSGKFHATKDGNPIESSSLAGIKKKLDQQPVFEKFTALYERYHRREFEKVEVIGIKRARQWWRSDEWVLSNGLTLTQVILDTLDNRIIIKERDEMDARHKELENQIRAEREAMNKRMPWLRPEKQS